MDMTGGIELLDGASCQQPSLLWCLEHAAANRCEPSCEAKSRQLFLKLARSDANYWNQLGGAYKWHSPDDPQQSSVERS